MRPLRYLNGRTLSPVPAEARQFIYQIRRAASDGAEERLRDEIRAALCEYEEHRLGEHYFLLELNRREEAKGTTVYHFEVPTDGRVPNVEFQQLGRISVRCGRAPESAAL